MNEEINMKIQFQVTLDDALAFNDYFIDHSAFHKRYYWITFMIPFLFALLIVITTPEFLWQALIIPVVWIIAYPPFYKWSNRYSARKIYLSGPNKGSLGEHTVIVTEESLLETTEVNEARWQWSGVERVEQNENYIFIFVGPNVAHIIPKRAFSTPELSTEFYDTTRQFFKKARAENKIDAAQ
jgi:hypothetical protein